MGRNMGDVPGREKRGWSVFVIATLAAVLLLSMAHRLEAPVARGIEISHSPLFAADADSSGEDGDDGGETIGRC